MEIKDAIQLRQESKEMIREKINEYCFKMYGIENLFSIIDTIFPKNEGLDICLARQIPTPNIEHLSLKLSVRYLSQSQGIQAQPLFMSFHRDAYPNVQNSYKKSLVNIPILFRSKKGTLITQGQKISKGDIQGMILSEIDSIFNKKLPEYHWELMEKAFYEDAKLLHKTDVTIFFQSVLNACTKNLPEKMYLRKGVKEELVETKELIRQGLNIKDLDLRPPATWYYFFYLCLFLDGHKALASTLDEDPNVLAWFDTNNVQMEQICGFQPFILDTPLRVNTGELVSKLEEVPKKALGGNGFLKSLGPLESNLDFFRIMNHYQKELITCS